MEQRTDFVVRIDDKFVTAGDKLTANRGMAYCFTSEAAKTIAARFPGSTVEAY